jgi:cellulose biosynthesis protein BcsQ
MSKTLALVGAVGGAGTTRLAVEMAATVARTGDDVAVVDAAFATQGLADYVEGRIETDVTALVTDESAEFGDALTTAAVGTPGRISMVPARAPFERLARAKTAGAAERFEKQVAAAALSHDVVIVDTPPVAANQAVAAVDAADNVAIVTPDSARGADGLARMRARLSDIGEDDDSVLANFADGTAVVSEADARIPTHDVTDLGTYPACLDPEGAFAPAVAEATEVTLDSELGLQFEDGGRLDGLLGN